MSAFLRLYVLGSLEPKKANRTLTTFAEYQSLRGLSRVDMSRKEVETLVSLIGNLRGYVESGYPAIDIKTLRDIGARLFNILVTERTKDIFLIANGENRASKRFLPLEIVAEDFEIAGWPWEYMYNSGDKSFIAQEFHPVSRSIFSINSRPALPPKKGRVSILLILGVPPDDPYTTPAEEVKSISEVFHASLGTENFDLEILPAADYKKLEGGIGSREVDIVHYFGHAGFDHEQGQGFLSIARTGGNPFKIHAIQFAQLLMESHVRLVFLNACKTAQGSTTDNPGRSSVAATLINAGIPAVIGTQFSLPDVSAHSLSATVYKALLTGKPIGEAVRVGRNAMFFAEKAAFFDWGIPVLYSTDPSQIIFPPSNGKSDQRPGRVTVYQPPHIVFTSGTRAPAIGRSEVLAGSGARYNAGDKTKANEKARVKVALLDIDAKVGFLPDLARRINGAQGYYYFKVVYVPIPSGYVRTDLSEDPQTFVPRLQDVLRPLPKQLQVDFVCGLTQHLIASGSKGREYWNYFTSSVTDSNSVFVISTFDLRRYAHQAKKPFAKAVFSLCLSMLVASDSRWEIDFHRKTAGCLFDFCENRDDIMFNLRKTKFDHKSCRSKIEDPVQLAAIDNFYALEFSEPGEPAPGAGRLTKRLR
jgi:hypothetical protein